MPIPEFSTATHDALTACPTIFSQAHGCNFVVIKTGEGQFRCLFIYIPDQQFTTGYTEYTRLEECVAAVLQVQFDHELGIQGATSGYAGKISERSNLKGPNT
ncbi:MAG: hypothetical protein OES26_03445 [Gammaproteobacteria bacterium]|nr:hypothetical protein [Gammaproteobacteria bacterium]